MKLDKNNRIPSLFFFSKSPLQSSRFTAGHFGQALHPRASFPFEGMTLLARCSLSTLQPLGLKLQCPSEFHDRRETKWILDKASNAIKNIILLQCDTVKVRTGIYIINFHQLRVISTNVLNIILWECSCRSHNYSTNSLEHDLNSWSTIYCTTLTVSILMGITLPSVITLFHQGPCGLALAELGVQMWLHLGISVSRDFLSKTWNSRFQYSFCSRTVAVHQQLLMGN